MTGLELRARLLPTGKQVTEIVRMAGISHQSLSQALKAQDVKTGLIEKLASALNLPLSYFYGGGNSERTVLEEKVRGMQKLLDEKDRTIQAYERLFALRAQGGTSPIDT